MTTTPPLVDKALVAHPMGDAQRQGLVRGEDGLLAEMTRLVLESALEGEMTAHWLGHDKHERGSRAATAPVPEPGQRRC